MSTLSSILSSIGGSAQASRTPSGSNGQRPGLPSVNSLANGKSLTPDNAAAGIKRKSDETDALSRPKFAKTQSDGGSNRGAPAAPPSRFQLSARSGVTQKNTVPPVRPAISSHPQSAPPKPVPRLENTDRPTSSNGQTTQKRGFAAVMEKARAAEEARKAVGSTLIKHKPVEKLTKRERLRLMEEAKALQKAAKHGKVKDGAAGKNDRPVTGIHKKGPDDGYKGTMRKAPEPLSYKGTMRAVDATRKKKKTTGQGQDKYGGYASWSDLDDVEDDEEDYESDEDLSDMEGGFDDLEQEEEMALREGRKEDRKMQDEEDRLRAEKLERKKKLERLNKSAAAKKRY